MTFSSALRCKDRSAPCDSGVLQQGRQIARRALCPSCQRHSAIRHCVPDAPPRGDQWLGKWRSNSLRIRDQWIPAGNSGELLLMAAQAPAAILGPLTARGPRERLDRAVEIIDGCNLSLETGRRKLRRIVRRCREVASVDIAAEHFIDSRACRQVAEHLRRSGRSTDRIMRYSPSSAANARFGPVSCCRKAASNRSQSAIVSSGEARIAGTICRQTTPSTDIDITVVRQRRECEYRGSTAAAFPRPESRGPDRLVPRPERAQERSLAHHPCRHCVRKLRVKVRSGLKAAALMLLRGGQHLKARSNAGKKLVDRAGSTFLDLVQEPRRVG